MLFNKHKKWRSPVNWEAYRKQRTLTTSIIRYSVPTYFDERCDITTHPRCHLITSNIHTPIPFDFKPITKGNIQSFISKPGSKKLLVWTLSQQKYSSIVAVIYLNLSPNS